VTSGGAEELQAGSGPEDAAPADDDEGAALQELAACLAPMLRQLPAAYREAVTLADLEGVDQAEAARRAGVTTSGMKSRVQRGRKQLKTVLEACCRIQLDRRGAIMAFDRRRPNACGCDGCD
jgi:RNA polymerase sigma-70 factor (ECF subfamily)